MGQAHSFPQRLAAWDHRLDRRNRDVLRMSIRDRKQCVGRRIALFSLGLGMLFAGVGGGWLTSAAPSIRASSRLEFVDIAFAPLFVLIVGVWLTLLQFLMLTAPRALRWVYLKMKRKQRPLLRALGGPRRSVVAISAVFAFVGVSFAYSVAALTIGLTAMPNWAQPMAETARTVLLVTFMMGSLSGRFLSRLGGAKPLM